jgi:YD repeat-containing protein
VIKKISLTLLTLLFVQSAFSCVSFAQSSGCGGFVPELLFWGDTIPAGWICNLPGEGPFSFYCLAPAANCSAGPVHWCPTCGKWVPSGGNPINLSNGNTYIQQMDVRLSGLGGGLSLERTWNSIWPANYSDLQLGIFGPNWRSTYEERVFTGSGNATNYMVYARSDGGLLFFGPFNGTNWKLASPASSTATLTQNGTTSWTITFQNGEQRVFSSASGSLSSIVDRNGNTTQLSYDGTNRLTTVTDPATRHLNFNYGSGSSKLVTSVTTDANVGISLSYAYDGSGRLAQVTKPDLTTVSFTYNTQSLITSVTDFNGKTLESHTYDGNGRGLTSSRAGGVDAVTISY